MKSNMGMVLKIGWLMHYSGHPRTKEKLMQSMVFSYMYRRWKRFMKGMIRLEVL